jgi:hypothetical protein
VRLINYETPSFVSVENKLRPKGGGGRCCILGYARCILITMLKTTVVFGLQDMYGVALFYTLQVYVSNSMEQVLLFVVRNH